MNASIRVQHKHEPIMRAVRVNGQITEVQQSKKKDNTKMGDHLVSIHFVFFQFGRNIRQISQILLLSWNFGKTLSIVAKRDHF